MDPLQAQIRLVTFFDTPDLALDAHGLVVRARRVQGRGDDSVIKLRPVVPDALPAGVRDSPKLVVEVDAMPGGYVCSATMKARLGTNDVRRALAGERSIRKLFSKEQRAFYEAHAPDGIALEDLSVLGPILVLKLNFRPAELDRKLVAEMWSYPNGSRILELSTKCKPRDAAHAALELRAYLADRGVERLREAADEDAHRADVLLQATGLTAQKWPNAKTGATLARCVDPFCSPHCSSWPPASRPPRARRRSATSWS